MTLVRSAGGLEGQVNWTGRTVRLHLETEQTEGEEVERAIRVCRQLIQDQQSERTNAQAGANLLSVQNESWLDESGEPVSRRAVENRIRDRTRQLTAAKRDVGREEARASIDLSFVGPGPRSIVSGRRSTA